MKKIFAILILTLSFLSTQNVFADAAFNLIDFQATTTANVGDPFKQRITFAYTGTSTKLKVTLSGNNPKQTGIDVGQVGWSGDGLNYVEISGTPLQAKVNKFKLIFSDSKYVKLVQPAVYDIQGLKFATTTLPDATELFKPYTATITYEYAGKDIPQFSYNFPVQFGRVDTNISNSKKSTTITFNPSLKGKYSFNITALNGRNRVLGIATLHINVTGTPGKKIGAKNSTTTNPSATTTENKKAPFSIKSIWSGWF